MGGEIVIAYAVEFAGIKGPYLEVREYPGQIGRGVYEVHADIFIGEGADPGEVGVLLAAAVVNIKARYISATACRVCERKGIAVPESLALVPLSI